jgi:hypothetical protein
MIYPKFLFAVLLFVMQFTQLLAQKKSTITFSAGAALPVGSFKETSSTVAGQSPGFAGAGLFADVLLQKKINQSDFSIAAIAGFTINFFRIDRVKENLQQQNQNFSWLGKHSNWVSIAVMPGICYSKAVSKKATFNAGLFTGPAFAKLPSYDIAGEMATAGFQGNAKAIQKTASAITIASRITTAINFTVGKNANMVIQAGYNYLKPTFKKVKTSFNQFSGSTGGTIIQFTSYGSEATYTQNMGTLNFGVGLVLSL